MNIGYCRYVILFLRRDGIPVTTIARMRAFLYVESAMSYMCTRHAMTILQLNCYIFLCMKTVRFKRLLVQKCHNIHKKIFRSTCESLCSVLLDTHIYSFVL